MMMMKKVMSICRIGGDCCGYSVATKKYCLLDRRWYVLVFLSAMFIFWLTHSPFQWWTCNTRRWLWWCWSCVAEGARCLFACHLWSSFVWPHPLQRWGHFWTIPTHDDDDDVEAVWRKVRGANSSEPEAISANDTSPHIHPHPPPHHHPHSPHYHDHGWGGM